MLPILIPVAWLAVVALLVALCRTAARADAEPAPGSGGHPRSGPRGRVVWRRDGLVVREEAPARALQPGPLQHRGPITRSRRIAPQPLAQRRLRAHGARAHAGRSAAES